MLLGWRALWFFASLLERSNSSSSSMKDVYRLEPVCK
jgi:hypothetical protein